jgi:hypothetical protein
MVKSAYKKIQAYAIVASLSLCTAIAAFAGEADNKPATEEATTVRPTFNFSSPP